MLVLTRQKGESIVIGDGEKRVVVTVTKILGDKVRVGITAPNEVPVHRQEVHEAIQRNGPKRDNHSAPTAASAVENSNRGGRKGMIHVTFADFTSMLFYANKKVWVCSWMSDNGEYFDGVQHIRAGDLQPGLHVIAHDQCGPMKAETMAKIKEVKRLPSPPEWTGLKRKRSDTNPQHPTPSPQLTQDAAPTTDVNE